MISFFAILNSCVEIQNSDWRIRNENITFSGAEVCAEIAQHKVIINAAKIWCYSQSVPSMVAVIVPNGDTILRLNEPSLQLLNLSRHNQNSRLSCREFWKNEVNYWDLIRDLRQCGRAENRIELLTFDGFPAGELGVVAMLLPNSPIFVSHII
ncbi:hypothetical protein [Floridanema evergladense]|uniref:Uncharacterized protein n=1 Tax=Floridaenema evergladense BLCC-F167 TaxID=3153639 RepID=A0ABV4WCW3_9CYAN